MRWKGWIRSAPVRNRRSRPTPSATRFDRVLAPDFETKKAPGPHSARPFGELEVHPRNTSTGQQLDLPNAVTFRTPGGHIPTVGLLNPKSESDSKRAWDAPPHDRVPFFPDSSAADRGIGVRSGSERTGQRERRANPARRPGNETTDDSQSPQVFTLTESSHTRQSSACEHRSSVSPFSLRPSSC